MLLDVLEWDVPVSYKAIVDGFNEIYHTASLHHVGPEWTKSARDTTFHIVNDHNYMCFVPRHDSPRAARRGLGSPPVRDLPLRGVPEHGLQLQPRARPGVQPDPDRRRPHPLPVLASCLSGRPVATRSTPSTTSARCAHWEQLKVVVGEDIEIYDQLARTKRSSAYRQNILSARECKIAHYHETMAEMIRG